VKASQADILIVPGFTGSGPLHWQTRWQKGLKTASRVELPGQDAPKLGEWVDVLERAVAGACRPVVLVAHCLGVLTVVHSLSQGRMKTPAGVFLVAPPDGASIRNEPDIDDAFADTPLMPLPCPATLVASRNDPSAGYEYSAMLAENWASQLVDAGEVGHINTASGHGPWPEGTLQFARFMASLKV
jgi:predicted alpha/beta hydrolase family esterase